MIPNKSRFLNLDIDVYQLYVDCSLGSRHLKMTKAEIVEGPPVMVVNPSTFFHAMVTPDLFLTPWSAGLANRGRRKPAVPLTPSCRSYGRQTGD